MDPRRGQASEAGEEMDSELDAIQERLQALKRELDARESVVDLDEDGVGAAKLKPSPSRTLGA